MKYIFEFETDTATAEVTYPDGRKIKLRGAVLAIERNVEDDGEERGYRKVLGGTMRKFTLTGSVAGPE